MNFFNNLKILFENSLSEIDSKEIFEFTYNDHVFHYLIKTSPRRKHLQIKIDRHSKITAHIPAYMSLEQAHSFIRSKSKWIYKHLQNLKEKADYRLLYIPNEKHYYLGNLYPLKITTLHISKISKIQFVDYAILISCTNPSPDNIQKLISQWYFDQAKKQFSIELEYCWNIFSLNHQYQKPILRIKKMKTRWGSLSSRGFINLNAYLTKASIACLQYVIFHELCHLVYFNHSPQFHQLVATYCPEWKTYHTWLKKLS